VTTGALGGSPVHIGAAAAASGVSAKMIRHYESLGLLSPVQRTDSGYRVYNHNDVHNLRFIKRARDLGFSMAEIADLLALWHDQGRPSTLVKAIAARHVQQLSERITALQDMKNTLQHLVSCCHGDARPECPILDTLAGNPETAS